jgi:hypothetical protein
MPMKFDALGIRTPAHRLHSLGFWNLSSMPMKINGCPWDQDTYAEAASGGHFETLIYARESGCPWDMRSCNLAVSHGLPSNVWEVAEWIHQNGCPFRGDEERMKYATIKVDLADD